MTQDNRLSVLDIARELNTGKATIKFLLKRFKTHTPYELIDGQPLYPVNTIKTLIMIQEKLEMGLLPSEIEEMLKTHNSEDHPSIESSLKDIAENSDIRLSHDGLHMLKSLFNDIGQQQERIAAAHEKRAQVEERKALAIEIRAKAEEKKAEAMNNIADALQEMNQLRSLDATSQQIAHQTGSVIIADESDESYEMDNLSELISGSDNFEATDTDLSSLLDEEDSLDISTQDPLSVDTDTEFDQELEASLDDPLEDFDEDLLNEDISSFEDDDDLTQNGDTEEQALDDLSSLIDTQADINDDTTDENLQTDDLSKLIDASDDSKTDTVENKDSGKETAPDVDDLSLLIDPVTDEESDIKSKPAEDQPDPSEDLIDDLSALIDEKIEDKPESAKDIDSTKDIELDDLSKLIDASDDSKTDAVENKDPGTETAPDMDDLSLLITPDAADKSETKQAESKEPKTPPENAAAEASADELDDLSKLIDTSDDSKTETAEEKPEKPAQKDAPAISLDISPEDDLGKYKAAVTKIIIELKAEGLTVEEATDRLNKNNIKTLSGKSKWGQKAITQIYKFIDSAK